MVEGVKPERSSELEKGCRCGISQRYKKCGMQVVQVKQLSVPSFYYYLRTTVVIVRSSPLTLPEFPGKSGGFEWRLDPVFSARPLFVPVSKF